MMLLIKTGVLLIILFSLNTLCDSCACEFHPVLSGKWFFTGENKNINIKIHSKIIVFKVSNYLKLRYKCTERYGNIYLLRILCLFLEVDFLSDLFMKGGFTSIHVEGRGFDSFIFSPKNVTRKYANIDNTCDSEISRERKFIYRKGGCRVPRDMVGTWGFTFRQSSAITMGKRNLTIHFLNNDNLTLNCEARDRNMFLFRRSSYINSSTDAIICVQIDPVLDDPFYDYEFNRIITGNAVENLVRTVPRGKKLYINSDCDMIHSPARPEYIYTVDNIL
ncbi:hypothetical protein LOTGIDRAFT_166720 [Lottia gigantea]|uniref:ZP domain-containing protein n=1 Tax=Lottia gigantea TaxID=225164 RepID=V3ZWK4_LOTGI|nr:hypothetical protein LOTGIDRAFT_166720 [Lottia gigantea]ESO86985.1 hypothetical protein LOTGIDRAFT_166720 [Lottia gigantea]